MGGGRWDPSDWSSYSSTYAGKATDAVFTSRSIKGELNPFGVKVRESRDSVDNPNSTAIILGLDVTGSMGIIADNLAREGLGVLIGEIYNRKPVSDPHVMFMGIGDAYYDTSPLQVSQFEADIRVAEQLKDLWLEKGGGGNSFESYNFPWYFAAMHTSIDCFEKRKKKGYLFTVGDEEVPPTLTKEHIKKFIGDDVQYDFETRDLLSTVGRMYHVFHVVAEEGSHARGNPDRIVDCWTNVLGQKVLRLSDHRKLSEVIVSAIQLTEGIDKDTVVKSWSGDTSMVVARAVNSLTTPTAVGGSGVSRF